MGRAKPGQSVAPRTERAAGRLHGTRTDAYTMVTELGTVLNPKQQVNGDGTSVSLSVTGKIISRSVSLGTRAKQTDPDGVDRGLGSVASCGRSRWSAEMSFLQWLVEAALTGSSEGGSVPLGHCLQPERRASCCRQLCGPGPTVLRLEAGTLHLSLYQSFRPFCPRVGGQSGGIVRALYFYTRLFRKEHQNPPG